MTYESFEFDKNRTEFRRILEQVSDNHKAKNLAKMLKQSSNQLNFRQGVKTGESYRGLWSHNCSQVGIKEVDECCKKQT